MRLLLTLTFALTFTLGFTLSVTQDGSMTFPKSACAAEACQTVSQIINGEYKVCRVCCTEYGNLPVLLSLRERGRWVGCGMTSGACQVWCV